MNSTLCVIFEFVLYC